MENPNYPKGAVHKDVPRFLEYNTAREVSKFNAFTESEFTDIVNNTSMEFAKQLARKHDEKLMEIFLKFTGEELTLKNAGRVCCITDQENWEELYTIDDIPVMIAYPLSYVWVNELERLSDGVKIKASRVYKELI